MNLPSHVSLHNCRWSFPLLLHEKSRTFFLCVIGQPEKERENFVSYPKCLLFFICSLSIIFPKHEMFSCYEQVKGKKMNELRCQGMRKEAKGTETHSQKQNMFIEKHTMIEKKRGKYVMIYSEIEYNSQIHRTRSISQLLYDRAGTAQHNLLSPWTLLPLPYPTTSERDNGTHRIWVKILNFFWSDSTWSQGNKA